MFKRLREDRAERKQSEERAKELRTKLLAQASENRQSKEAEKAITYCEMCITEYEWWFEWNEARWTAWQKVTIIGGVIATLAGVISIPDPWMKWAPDGWQSLSMATRRSSSNCDDTASFLGSFNYREDAVRDELTANALWNELAKYQAKAEPYNGDETRATSVFMNTVCGLVDSELRNWSALVNGLRNAENADKNPPQLEHGTPNPTPPVVPPSGEHNS